MNRTIPLFFILFSLISCALKPVPFGRLPLAIDHDIKFVKGKIHFPDERLAAKYIISGWQPQDEVTDFIIFFHGIGWNEKYWIKKDGFGDQYYRYLALHPEVSHIPVVSVSMGAALLLTNDVPPPYDADMLDIFINRLIPFFREKMNAEGQIYLLGHSMGGFNALQAALQYPEQFSLVCSVSPFIRSSLYLSSLQPPPLPDEKKRLWRGMEKTMLEIQFPEKNRWLEYDLYNVIHTIDATDDLCIILTRTNVEPGDFIYEIDAFRNVLAQTSLSFHYLVIAGSHHSPDLSGVYDLIFSEIARVNISRKGESYGL